MATVVLKEVTKVFRTGALAVDRVNQQAGLRSGNAAYVSSVGRRGGSPVGAVRRARSGRRLVALVTRR